MWRYNSYIYALTNAVFAPQWRSNIGYKLALILSRWIHIRYPHRSSFESLPSSQSIIIRLALFWSSFSSLRAAIFLAFSKNIWTLMYTVSLSAPDPKNHFFFAMVPFSQWWAEVMPQFRVRRRHEELWHLSVFKLAWIFHCLQFCFKDRRILLCGVYK